MRVQDAFCKSSYICFLSIILWYNKPNKSKNHTAFHLLPDFVENQINFWDYRFWNSVQITDGSEIQIIEVHTYIHTYIHTYVHIYSTGVHICIHTYILTYIHTVQLKSNLTHMDRTHATYCLKAHGFINLYWHVQEGKSAKIDF